MLPRLAPTFFVIGGQKCGTTSLFAYLAAHPEVLPAAQKEIHYFSDQFARGRNWYRQWFPFLHRSLLPGGRGRLAITGEATPYYLFHPHAARRIAERFPRARIIVMLRNPVDRALSHYNHHVKLGVEPLDFEAAIEAEPQRLEGELEQLLADASYPATNYKLYSYLSRGVYADQLARWFEYFGPAQVLIIRSEDFFADPRTGYRQVQDFLGLSRYDLDGYRIFNEGAARDLSANLQSRLADYFEPHNERLYRLLDRDLGWR